MRPVAVAVLALALAAGAIAVPNKPVWPKQFSAPFALYDLTSPTPVVGETSQFLYHFDSDLEAQRIVYPTQCLPLLPNGSTQPCELIFVNNTVFFSQPALNKPCCTLVPGVGPIPPAFLGGFNWTSVQSAPDMYGVQHTCNYWTGSGFAYWTDATTNHDVFFNDGGSGAFWAWGKFNVTEQPAELFALPGTASECSNLCIFGPENDLGTALDAVAELDADDMAERDAALAKVASLRLALMSRHIRA